MDRVVTLVQQQGLLAELMRSQRQLATTQEQIATGKVGDQFKDLVPQVGVMLAAKRQDARIDGFVEAGRELSQRLAMQDLHVGALADEAQELRQSVLEAIANGSGMVLMERLEGIFDQAVGLLNARSDGRHIYAGTRSDVAPVNVSSLAGLVAAPSVADVFENNTVKPAARIDESQVIEYGLLASELGTALFTSLRNIAAYQAGPNGPFGATLTADQRQFLEGELAGITAAHQGLTVATGQNGLRQSQVEDALERHEASGIVLKSLISDIEDVDLAEAVSRLNQTQLAVQAAARVLAEVNELSLLNVLR